MVWHLILNSFLVLQDFSSKVTFFQGKSSIPFFFHWMEISGELVYINFFTQLQWIFLRCMDCRKPSLKCIYFCLTGRNWTYWNGAFGFIDLEYIKIIISRCLVCIQLFCIEQKYLSFSVCFETLCKPWLLILVLICSPLFNPYDQFLMKRDKHLKNLSFHANFIEVARWV